jgi:hypothetical protein
MPLPYNASFYYAYIATVPTDHVPPETLQYEHLHDTCVGSLSDFIHVSSQLCGNHR